MFIDFWAFFQGLRSYQRGIFFKTTSWFFIHLFSILPCPYTSTKIFWANQNVLGSDQKIELYLVPLQSVFERAQKLNLLMPCPSTALSFYRSQNVLCWSKYFVLDQKLKLHLLQLQNFLCRHLN